MAKRSLYAAVQAAASLAALLTVLPASAQTAAPRQTGACAACVAIDIDPGAASSLPEPLEGMSVFVRVAGGAESTANSALLEIERKGGRPSLLIATPTAGIQSGVAGHARRIVVAAGLPAAGQ